MLQTENRLQEIKNWLEGTGGSGDWQDQWETCDEILEEIQRIAAFPGVLDSTTIAIESTKPHVLGLKSALRRENKEESPVACNAALGVIKASRL